MCNVLAGHARGVYEHVVCRGGGVGSDAQRHKLGLPVRERSVVRIDDLPPNGALGWPRGRGRPPMRVGSREGVAVDGSERGVVQPARTPQRGGR